MPKDREYLFPAIAVVQNYVNGFQNKMRQQDTAPHILDKHYQLKYALDMEVSELAFFLQLGLQLAQQPEPIAYPDAIIDLTEERLHTLQTGRRHVADIYGIMAGVNNCIAPLIRRVRPRLDMTKWATIGLVDAAQFLMPIQITGEELANAHDNEYSGIIGVQSWETYLAASMGLPVIEILPSNRKKAWLSKWFNPGYRMVEEAAGRAPQQVRQAFDNLERLICSPAPVDQKTFKAPMERIPSSVISAASQSPVLSIP